MTIHDDIQASLGCCARPSLQTLKNLGTARHGTCALRRCAECGQHWIYRCDDYDNWEGPTQVTIWYMAVPSADAEELLRSTAESPELAVSATAALMFEYAEGQTRFRCRPVGGIPHRPW